MSKTEETDFIIQLVEITVDSSLVEVKEALDSDYKYLVGLAVPDGKCSDAANFESIKVKGIEFLPSGLEITAITSTKNVEPNKRFFTLFKPVKVSGEDLVIKLSEPALKASYVLKLQVLLSNNPEGMQDVLNA